MADVTVANTAPGIAGKTLACHDADGTTTGIWTFANPLALKGPAPANQTWRLSVAGSGNLNVLADGTGGGFFLNAAGAVGFTGDITEKGRATPLGHWVEEPFNASHFSATGGTWTMGAAAVFVNRYTLIGKTLLWSLYLSWFSGSNVASGPVTSFDILLPGGVTPKVSSAHPLGTVIDAGTNIDGVNANVNSSTLSITKKVGGAFASGPAGTPFGVVTTIIVEVQ